MFGLADMRFRAAVNRQFLQGPYEAAILEVNECQDNTGNQFGFTTKLTKISKSEKVWTTNVTLVCDLDNSSKLVFDAEKWGSGGWQKNALHHEGEDICNSALKNLPDIFNVMLEHSGVAAECPVKKGPYEVAILEVNECQDNTGNQFGFTTKLTKMSKSEKVWTTNVTLVCDMDTSSKFMFSVEKWGFGGWQKNAFQREAEDVCNKALNDLPELFNVGLKRSGIAAECPVKKGFYTLTEFPTKWEKQEKFPSLPYGKYRAEARLFCSGEVIGCLSITVDVTEIPDE